MRNKQYENKSLVIYKCRDAFEHGQELEATDIIVDFFDETLGAGDFETAKGTLYTMEKYLLPPKVITGILMITWPARNELGDVRIGFRELPCSQLSENHHFSDDEVKKIKERFQ